VARPPASFAESLSRELAPLRVAIRETSFFGAETEPEAGAAVRAAAAALEGIGHHVEEACPTVAEESLRACMEAVWSVDLASLADAFARINRREAGPGQVEAASWACIRRGREIS